MAIFDELRTVASVLQEAGKIEQYQQILSIQKELLEQQKHIHDLEIENRELKEKLRTKDSLEFKDGAYWTVGEKKDGPFCQRCWDVNKNTVRMRQAPNPAFNVCPECKNTFQSDSGYQPPYKKRSPMSYF